MHGGDASTGIFLRPRHAPNQRSITGLLFHIVLWKAITTTQE